MRNRRRGARAKRPGRVLAPAPRGRCPSRTTIGAASGSAPANRLGIVPLPGGSSTHAAYPTSACGKTPDVSAGEVRDRPLLLDAVEEHVVLLVVERHEARDRQQRG